MASPQEKRHVANTLARILLATILGASLAGAPAMAQEDVQEPPRIVFDAIVHDAGHVERGEMITHEFTFRNTGGSDLVILSTKAG